MRSSKCLLRGKNPLRKKTIIYVRPTLAWSHRVPTVRSSSSTKWRPSKQRWTSLWARHKLVNLCSMTNEKRSNNRSASWWSPRVVVELPRQTKLFISSATKFQFCRGWIRIWRSSCEKLTSCWEEQRRSLKNKTSVDILTYSWRRE